MRSCLKVICCPLYPTGSIPNRFKTDLIAYLSAYHIKRRAIIAVHLFQRLLWPSEVGDRNYPIFVTASWGTVIPCS